MLDSSDAIMRGVANYLQWRDQFLSEFQEDIQKGNIQRAWAMMPEPMKEWLKQNDPAGYKQVLEFVGGEHG